MAFKMKYGKHGGFPFKTDPPEEEEGERVHKVNYNAQSQEFIDREKKRKSCLLYTSDAADE